MVDSRSISPPAKPRSTWLKWLDQGSLARKQLFALTLCQLMPILGLAAGSTIAVSNVLRSQWLTQAKSELAVAETHYNIKIDQMSLGARRQAEHPAVIAAAKSFQRSDTLPNDVQTQLQQVLQNEAKAQQIEFATLVHKDLRIIANANTKRSKETIAAPKLAALIQQVLKDGTQIKANQIVDWEELRKEAPPLPEGLQQQDALIRYVVTPVRDPEKSDTLLGVLVFGEVANRKLPIVENTLRSLGGGYSAIYQRRENGEFRLATSLHKSSSASAQVDVALANPALLNAAIAAQGEAVTQQIEIDGQAHTVAAKALPNRIVETSNRARAIQEDQPSAIVVRGTPELAFHQVLWNSGPPHAIALALALIAIAVWSRMLRRSVLNPIQDLHHTTVAFANGDREARATVWAEDELGELAIALNRLVNSVCSSEQALSREIARQAQQTQQTKALGEMTVSLYRSGDPTQIVQTAIAGCRDFLKLDRVLIYEFQNAPLDAIVTAESVSDPRLSVMHKVVVDPLGLQQWEAYRSRSAWIINNARTDLTPTYQQQAAALQTQAELVIPLQQNAQLTGLVCAQICEPSDRNCEWLPAEVEFFSKLVAQLGDALDQAQRWQARQTALQHAERYQDDLQQQMMQLFSTMQAVSAGDLTAQIAPGTAGELGAIATSVQTIVDQLRGIVANVKQTAAQVQDLLSQDADEVAQLAAQARQQAQSTHRTLAAVEQVTLTMQAVAERAQKAAIAAETATAAAQSGETVMHSTVTSIYSLRATVEDATRKVKQLGESSQQIGRVVSLINDLATQTDLLAINASLEATRAGEHGRGFSLVANEIADLASRSATATCEIKALIENIQRQTSEVVDTMHRGAHQVVEGAHLARNAKQSLIHVVQVSQQMDQLVHSISETMATQTGTARSLTTLIQEVAEVSMCTSDSSLRLSAALHQTVNVVEDLHASVEMFTIQADARTSECTSDQERTVP